MVDTMALMATTMWSFLTTPLGQIVFWGALTSFVFMHTGYAYLIRITGPYCDDFRYEQTLAIRFMTATIVEFFWIVNVTCYMCKALDFMIYTDLFFTVISFIVYRQTKLLWVAGLTALYVITVFIDVALRLGLDSVNFSWLSNVVYTLQLATMLGLMDFLFKRIKSGLIWVKRRTISVFNLFFSTVPSNKSESCR